MFLIGNGGRVERVCVSCVRSGNSLSHGILKCMFGVSAD